MLGKVQEEGDIPVWYFLFVHSSHRECDIPRGSVMDGLSHTVE